MCVTKHHTAKMKPHWPISFLRSFGGFGTGTRCGVAPAILLHESLAISRGVAGPSTPGRRRKRAPGQQAACSWGPRRREGFERVEGGRGAGTWPFSPRGTRATKPPGRAPVRAFHRSHTRRGPSGEGEGGTDAETPRRRRRRRRRRRPTVARVRVGVEADERADARWQAPHELRLPLPLRAAGVGRVRVLVHLDEDASLRAGSPRVGADPSCALAG